MKRPALPFDPIEAARELWCAHGWADAAPRMALVASIMRVQQIVLHRTEVELRPLGLSLARYEALMLLVFSRNGELPLGKMGSRLQVQPGAITNAIDRLEADGYVERRPHPTDGRTTLARILPAGRSLAERATEILNQRVYESLDLPASDVDRLFELLKEIRARAGDFRADGGAPATATSAPVAVEAPARLPAEQPGLDHA